MIVDGFYEWRTLETGRKQPYRICRHDGQVFTFAGMWSPTDQGDRCTILTGAAQGVVSPLHNRMPIVVRPADHSRWLDHAEHAPIDLLQPDARDLVAYAVSRAVNNVRRDDPSLIGAVAEEERRQLRLLE